MNRKLGKFLSLSLIPCFMNFGFAFAMDGDSDENMKIIKSWRKHREEIYGGCMSGGYVYTSSKYPDLVMKTIPDAGCDTFEMRACRALEGKHVSENLMYVEKVLDDKVFIFGRICGKTLDKWLKEYKNKLELDFFIEKWCIGLFDATEIFRKYTGEYKGDIALRNIMVDEKKLIPILIDFGDNYVKSKRGKIGDLAGCLKRVMSNEFVKSDGYVDKWNKLKKYLEEIEESNEYDINRFRQIKAGTAENC